METLYLKCNTDAVATTQEFTTELICATDATPIFYMLMFHFALLIILVIKR